MIDVKDLEIQCAGRWFSILTNLGVPESYLTEKHGPCLFCKGFDRWRWDNKDGSGTYICGQCGAGTPFQLVMKHLGINFQEALKRIEEILGGGYTKVEPQTNNKMSTEDIKKMLNKLWTSSLPLTGGDHACKYLHSRGLVLEPDNVKFCEECWESDTKKNYPAMVAKIVDKNNAPIGIHRTYLESDVAKQAEIESPKKMTPVVDTLVGCAVRLFEPVDNTIIVCEGIETAIACVQIFDIPAWSCLSSTILQGFEPPDNIRKVIICSDSDANFTGQAAAYKLAKRLFAKDLIVEVRLPETIGSDFADELWRSIK